MSSPRKAPSSILLLLALLGATVLAATVSAAKVSVGQDGICCAYIGNGTKGGWVLTCNDPTNIPGAQQFPGGTVIRATQFVPGTITQCFGSFPVPVPRPYSLPTVAPQLFAPPGGGDVECAGQFGTFYQSLGVDGGFLVQCTK